LLEENRQDGWPWQVTVFIGIAADRIGG